MSSQTSELTPKKPPHSAETWKNIRLSTLPKVFFFYPLVILSFLFAVAAGNDPPKWMGLLWFGMFALNLAVLSFDLNEDRAKTIAVLFVALIIALFGIGVVGSMTDWLSHLPVKMNWVFYLLMASLLTLFILVGYIGTWMDYWQFSPDGSSIIHKKGKILTAHRYPTEDLFWDVHHPDLVEYLMSGTGQVILYWPHYVRKGHPLVVLENVRFISTVEEALRQRLGDDRRLSSLSFKLVGQQMVQIVSASGSPVPSPPKPPSSGR